MTTIFKDMTSFSSDQSTYITINVPEYISNLLSVKMNVSQVLKQSM